MNLSEVQYQPWSTVTTNFYICQSCGIVDTESKRHRVGTPCNNCAAPSPGGLLYFEPNAYSIVASIQDFYFLRHAKPPPDTDGLSDHVYTNETDTRIVIPLLFCTLWDVLTIHISREVMRAKHLEQLLQDRLLLDYRFSREKREKLLPALTGEKWKEALAELTKRAQIDYTEHFTFFLNINEKRNEFIHEGSHWSFDDEELERIPEELKPTFNLFAELHNRWVARV